MKDMINPSCDQCQVLATHGMPTCKATKCGLHRAANMIFKPRKRCAHDKCTSVGTFMDRSNSIIRYCEVHHLPDSINLALEPCASCGTLNILYKDKLCSSCDPDVAKRVVHAKELLVKSWLDTNGFKYDTHDKILDKGVCNAHRPDFSFDVSTHVVILEVDEHQHRSYDSSCERSRMLNIAQGLGINVIFIRYNPDAYVDPSGVKRTPHHNKRMEELRRWLEHCMHHSQNPALSGAFVDVVHLYYDGFDASSAKIRHLQLLDCVADSNVGSSDAAA